MSLDANLVSYGSIYGNLKSLQRGDVTVVCTAYVSGQPVVNRFSFPHNQEKAPLALAQFRVNGGQWYSQLRPNTDNTIVIVSTDDTNVYINTQHTISSAPTVDVRYYLYWRDDA